MLCNMIERVANATGVIRAQLRNLYTYQITMLYALNVHNVICQLYSDVSKIKTKSKRFLIKLQNSVETILLKPPNPSLGAANISRVLCILQKVSCVFTNR